MARRATRTRKARPGLEPLEGRQLLDAGGLGLGAGGGQIGIVSPSVEVQSPGIEATSAPTGAGDAGGDSAGLAAPGVTISGELMTHAEQRAAQNGQPDPPPLKTLRYVTPQRVQVVVNLQGPGTLAGSAVRPDGALDLVYDGTGPDSQIFAHATGIAPLASVRDADVPLDAQAGAGANQLGLAGFRPFNLIDGGTINLIGGVRRFGINNVGRNTQVFMRELPEVAAEREAQLGREQTFATDQAGGVELVLTDGNFFPILTSDPEPPVEPPPGIRIQIAGRVNGDPLPDGQIGNAQFWGYDAANSLLIRFDTVTGAVLQTVDVPSIAGSAGVTTTKLRGDRLVVLVGQADLVRAYDAIDGSFVGSFTTANLPAIGAIDGMGTTDLRTVLVDSTFGSIGAAQAVNIPASLASGVAVATTPAFQPTRDFGFLGGATGVPGFDPLAVLGRGFFDSFQPTTEILGAMAIDTSDTPLEELYREGAPGLPTAPPPGTDEALGSVDGLVGRVVGVVDGKNLVNLVNRTDLSREGQIGLDYPNPLNGLSESFRPTLRGTSVFDIQGDVQAFLAQDARGLVVNTLGTLHLVGINRARDSFIVGFPLNHVYLGPGSRDVTLVTPTERPPGTRPDVTVIPGLQPIGPLFIP